MNSARKWDLMPSELSSLRAAIFRTEKTNAREPDPNNPLLNVLAGTQRVNGAQVEVTRAHHEPLGAAGELCLSRRQTGELELLSGRDRRARWPTCRATRSTSGTTVRLPWRFEGGAGANYRLEPNGQFHRAVRSRSPDWSSRCPGYWVFNAMAEAAAERARRSAGERQQPRESLLLRRACIPRTSCWGRAARRWSA